MVQEVLQRRQEPWRLKAQWPVFRSWQHQLRGLSKLILLQLHKKLPKNSVLTILWLFSIWSKLKGWKSSIHGCFMSWLQIKKIIILKCLLLFCTKQQTTFQILTISCAMESGFYMTTGDDQLGSWTVGQRRNPKTLPKAKVLVAQSCPTLCDPMDSNSPGSSVHGILQARILEWVAIPFSRGFSRLRHWTWVSCVAGRFFINWDNREATAF